MQPAAPPAARDAHVQVAGIHQPRNRGPRLFRIPVPVRAPRRFAQYAPAAIISVSNGNARQIVL